MKSTSRRTSRRKARSIMRATWPWCAPESKKCAVVLASATPSLETYVNATSGRYKWLKLPRRHGAATMPEVRLIDLRRERAEPGTWLSQPLREALATTLGERRTGDAVSQPPRLCAAHVVRSVRAQDDLPPMFGVAGGASLSPQARLSSLRPRPPLPRACPQCQTQRQLHRLRTRRGTRGGGIRERLPAGAHGDCLQRHPAWAGGNAGRYPRHGEARDRCGDRHADRRQGPPFSPADSGRRDRRRSRRHRTATSAPASARSSCCIRFPAAPGARRSRDSC